MKKQPYMPTAIPAYASWHDNLKANVTAATPGATAADVTMLATDNAALHAKITAAKTADIASIAAHADLNTILKNTQANARDLAGRIKTDPEFTPPLGATLQLIGAENAIDLTVQKPQLIVRIRMNGVVELDFEKLGGLVEGVHLYSMREGETVFTYLASETHAAYVDNRPLLVPGKPETRQYKAMYFIGKTEIGLISDVVTAIAAP